MPAPIEIQRLVDHFEANKRAYLNPRYNETSLRNEFLDPFFIALGWDVGNKHMHADAYKEVVLETSQEVEGSARKPDYVFRAGGFQKFFVEAKKPFISIETDSKPAFQVRRYAWSAKLPLSILTDFEEFAVYECRNKPAESDSPATGRIELLQYTDYVKKWDWLYDTFSREAVFQGAYDRYAEGVKGKRGTQEVDDDFLKTIESWRDLLARDIARRNTALSTTELNYAVQMTIDRIIFLRICEDREIEPDGQLKTAAASPNIYASLVSLFRQADERYNSGLFHFRAEAKQSSTPDDLSLSLSVDDKALKEIIGGLYYPSPYVFREIPADILGQVYEKFLGKVIRLTAGHQAKVEEKPEVRKAGGVYYTPTYIVDYIVKHTVGELVKDKTPAQVAALKILDPACGSGSFLLGAYQYLLNWHTDWYASNNPEKWAKGTGAAIYPAPGGGWRLTTAEKKRILLNNIHGVDIDPQAVEVTKLSLSLKVLEGESQQTIGAQLALFKERALPDLARNIQCGNSLIGWDYTEGRLFADEEEKRRVNPFDWESAFPQVFKQGGFDAVIGNPPYVRQETIGSNKTYLQTHYQVFSGTADLYTYFIEKGVTLLRENGIFCYIVANKWMRAKYGEPLRKWIRKQDLLEITDFGDLPVFEEATTYPCILRIAKAQPKKNFIGTVVPNLGFRDLDEVIKENGNSINLELLSDTSWTISNSEIQELIEKIKKNTIPLGNYINFRLYRGVLTGLNEAFIVDEGLKNRIVSKDKKYEKIIKPFLTGKEIKRYESPLAKKYLIFIPKGWTNSRYMKKKDKWEAFSNEFPLISKHLEPYSKSAEKRWDKGDYWWELRACDYYSEFETQKFIFPDISIRGNFIFDSDGMFYSVNTTYILPSDDLFLLGLLNSRLFTFIYTQISASYRGGYLRYIYQYIIQLPIRKIDLQIDEDNQKHSLIVNLVANLIKLNRLVGNTPQEKETLQREIAATDRQIDQLVYKLYGLTEDEIKIVEGE